MIFSVPKRYSRKSTVKGLMYQHRLVDYDRFCLCQSLWENRQCI